MIIKVDNLIKNSTEFNPPPLYDTFPTSIRTRIDPKTNAVIPKIDAVKDLRRWCEENTK